MIKPLVIRADAGGALGTGHVMRMIALAQAYIRRGGRVVIASVQCPGPVVDRVEELGIEHHLFERAELGDAQDAASTLKLGKDLGAQWMVLDGYHFDESYQQQVSGYGIKILAVDDYGHCSTWHCDAVLNQNLGAENWQQKKTSNPEIQWMLGSPFALIREEFLESIRNAQEKPFPAQRIIVTMGGADPDNVTLMVLKSLENTTVEDLEIRVLVGGTNPHQNVLFEFAESSRYEIEVLCNVRDMPSMYEWADAVISAGGSTCWEWLAYGLPGAVVTIAENQEPLIREFTDRNLALCLGWFTKFDLNEWAKLFQSWIESQGNASSYEYGRNIIDGYGAERTAAGLSDGLWSRCATAEDTKLYFNWANDPAVRSSGFHTAKLEWEDHCKWFEKMSHAQNTYLYVVSNVLNVAIGQVRLTPDPSDYLEIGFSIDSDYRGKGLATPLLEHALNRVLHEKDVVKGFIARVKKENASSAKVFLNLRFRQIEDDLEHGCLVYIKEIEYVEDLRATIGQENAMVKLSPIVAEKHASFIFEARQHPDVLRFMYNQDKISWNDHLRWIEANAKDHTRVDWVVEHNKNMVGRVSLTDIDRGNRRAEFGMFISSEKARIQGVGAAAEYLALQYAFDQLNLVKVSCEVFSVNEAPIRMHKRMGFIQEGVLRKHAFYESKLIDVVRLSILSDEWKQKQQELGKAINRLIS